MQPSPSPWFIGVDVAKAELVISLDGQRRHSVANHPQVIKAWLKDIPPGSHIAMESTGRYHDLLAQLAGQVGLTVYVPNARDVFFYAKALGTRAKTDGVDAHVIQRYLVEHHQRLHPWQPGSAVQQQLQTLLSRRARIATERAALRQTLMEFKEIGVDTAPLQTAFNHLLKSIDAKIEELIETDAKLVAGCQQLRTIPGIGPQASAMLVALFCRLPFAHADALVAYCGLDPRPNDSGTKRGRRRLSKKGPPLLRRQIYLTGLAASRSKALKPHYQALRAKGFVTTAACVILGRKLLRTAWAVWKSGQPFDPKRLLPEVANA